MSYVDFIGKGVEEAKKGKDAQANKDYVKARSCYMAAVDYFLAGKKRK